MLPRYRPRQIALLAVTGVPFVALLVAVLAVDGAPLGVDRWWASVMATAHVGWLTTVERLISDLGGGIVGGVLVPGALALVVWRLRSRRAATVFVGVMVASLVVAQVVKHLVARPRPPTAMMADAFNSFPSGHVANATTMTLLLLVLLRRRVCIAVAVVWPLLMVFSRTYLGVHWLTDTIAGACLGAFVVLAAAPLVLPWASATLRSSSPDTADAPSS